MEGRQLTWVLRIRYYYFTAWEKKPKGWELKLHSHNTLPATRPISSPFSKTGFIYNPPLASSVSFFMLTSESLNMVTLLITCLNILPSSSQKYSTSISIPPSPSLNKVHTPPNPPFSIALTSLNSIGLGDRSQCAGYVGIISSYVLTVPLGRTHVQCGERWDFMPSREWALKAAR